MVLVGFADASFQTTMGPTREHRQIELIIDCTNYTTASEIPMQWFKFFIELTPSDLRSRFRSAYILNCNLPMQRFLRKLYNICSGLPIRFAATICAYVLSGIFTVEIRPMLSVSELCEAVDCNIADSLKTACKYYMTQIPLWNNSRTSTR